MTDDPLLSEWEEGSRVHVPCPGCLHGRLEVIIREDAKILPCPKCGRRTRIAVTRDVCGWRLRVRLQSTEDR